MRTKFFTLLILSFPIFCSSQILWDNFEDTRIGYYEFVHGGMTNRFENPMPTSSVNSSELCTQYMRNPGETFDVIVIISNGPFLDLNDYLTGDRKMTVDVFSPGPGIPLQITLEDSSIAENPSGNYPLGRHSIYTSTTTATNEWETIEFVFDSCPDSTFADLNVTSLILLFDIGHITTYQEYYFDNLYGPEFDNQCDGIVADPSVKFADWDCNWNLRFCPSNSVCTTYDYMSGWLNHTYNPDNTGINSSKYSSEYTRNPDPTGEDVLVSYFTDAPLDLSMNKYFNFKLYGPPRPFYISFQDASGNDIIGYNSAISSFNEWQQFSFDLSSVASNSIERFVLFFDQGAIGVYDSYHLDDFNLSSMQLQINDSKNSITFKIYPQPADNYLDINFDFNESDELNMVLYDIQGKALLSRVIDLNMDHISLDVSGLYSGIYFVKIQSNNNLFTKQIQIIR